MWLHVSVCVRQVTWKVAVKRFRYVGSYSVGFLHKSKPCINQGNKQRERLKAEMVYMRIVLKENRNLKLHFFVI